MKNLNSFAAPTAATGSLPTAATGYPATATRYPATATGCPTATMPSTWRRPTELGGFGIDSGLVTGHRFVDPPPGSRSRPRHRLS